MSRFTAIKELLYNWKINLTSINPDSLGVGVSWGYLDHLEWAALDRVADGLYTDVLRVGLGEVVQVLVDVVQAVVVLPTQAVSCGSQQSVNILVYES